MSSSLLHEDSQGVQPQGVKLAGNQTAHHQNGPETNRKLTFGWFWTAAWIDVDFGMIWADFVGEYTLKK